jgi:hypothetical protein
MTERFEISFTEGGVDTFETIITGGLAKVTEKALDAISGDENHGWNCTIKDRITDLKVTCWGVTKGEAQEKAHQELKRKIEDFEYETEREKRYLEKQQAEQKKNSDIPDNKSSSDDSGCATMIGWLIGIGIVVFVVVWLAVNVVLPVALLNSALVLSVLAFVFKKHKTLFATLALVGGGYMLLDITNGWLSVNFVERVVKNPDWISAFVYINAAALGLCAWLLIQPIWLKTEQMEPTEKRKSLLLKGALILLIVIATSVAPVIYHIVQNPFIQKTSHNQASYQSQSDNQKNEVGTSKTQTTMIENQFIVDTYLGKIGEKEFKLFIEKVEGENVEGYNVTGSNRRPVKGKIVNKWTEPTGLGGNYTIFKLILTEPGDDKWDGEFNIDLWISDIGRHGEGNWKSFNGKLERQIKIKDRLNE